MMPTNGEIQLDALLPPDMAAKAESTGVRKANMNWLSVFTLVVMAGAFIAIGAIFSTTVSAGAADLPFGVSRLLAGLVFSLGLILVIVGGAELFTGNNLIIMAWASGKVTTVQLLRNWLIVYIGNFVGSCATAILMFVSGHYLFGKGAVGLAALSTANAKTGLDMYFIPIGLFIKMGAAQNFWETIKKTPDDFPFLAWDRFFVNNLLPVTIGNIIGGALLVGVVYWFVYLRKNK